MSTRYPKVPADGRCPTCGDWNWASPGVAGDSRGNLVSTWGCDTCEQRVTDPDAVIR